MLNIRKAGRRKSQYLQVPDPEETYTYGQTVRIPIRLKDEDGIGHVFADFKLLKTAKTAVTFTPPSIDPYNTMVLEGDGGGQTEATVQVAGTVTANLLPGDYLCVSISVYDAHQNLHTIRNPSPSKVFRIVRGGVGDPGEPPQFLGWG